MASSSASTDRKAATGAEWIEADALMSAQLEYDFAEAKRALMRELVPHLHSSAVAGIVNALESYCGKFVMRWWFARIAKNRAARQRYSERDIEERRRVRATLYVAMAQAINAKATAGKPPDALMLQTTQLDAICATSALWQALIDAAIITPDAKQDYLDAAVSELAERVERRSHQLDLGTRRIATP